MEIVLLKDVNNIGRAGDLKHVSDGYAKNYLIPKKLAVPATSPKAQQIKKEQIEKKEKQEKDEAKSLELKAKLESKIFAVKAKASKDHLFASVKEAAITKSINDKLNLDLTSDQIIIKDTIKQVGQYKILLKLTPTVSAVITIKVEP